MKHKNRLSLLINYLKTARRNSIRHLAYYTANLIGLTIGISCFGMMLLYAHHEMTYDDFHHNSEELYRINGQPSYSDSWFGSIPDEYSNLLVRDQIADVSDYVILGRTSRKFVEYVDEDLATNYNRKRFSETGVLTTTSKSRFFEMFDFKVIDGNKDYFLQQPYSAVITESTRLRYFGSADPIGKTLKFDEKLFKVTGVIQDIPSQSHFKFDFLVTYDEHIIGPLNNEITYIRVKSADKLPLIKRQLLSAVTNIASQYDSLRNVELQAVQDIQLHSEHISFGMKPKGSTHNLKIFSLIAIVILIIACTNYMNLCTAIYTHRRTEIGVRKILGGTKGSLTKQFLIESVSIAFLTIPLTVLLTSTVLPYLNNFLEVQMTNQFIENLWFALILVGITMLTGLIAGAYPSVILPRIHVLNLFKKENHDLKKGLNMRKVLITIQFTLLIALGSGAYFINKQLQFTTNQDLGIKTEGVVKLKQAYALKDNYQQFKTALLTKKPFIQMVSHGSAPGDKDYFSEYQAEGEEVKKDALYNITDDDYFELLGIEGLYGPYFNEPANERPLKSAIVNEAFVKNLNWEDPIGKTYIPDPMDPKPAKYIIRGVVKDFNFFSLHQKISPYVFMVKTNTRQMFQNVLVKIDLNYSQEAFKWIEETWAEILPEEPLHYEFLNEDIQKQYKSDKRVSLLSFILAIVAMAQAVLGLVGLSAFMTSLRIKEIGIRKVLGAPLSAIIILLNKEYILLVTISTIIATGLGYYFVAGWLDAFAYRISIGLHVFPLIGLFALAVAMFTVSHQSYRASRVNPSTTLRSE